MLPMWGSTGWMTHPSLPWWDGEKQGQQKECTIYGPHLIRHWWGAMATVSLNYIRLARWVGALI